MPVPESGDRYLLDEVLVLYQLEPSLRDLYVEGRRDAGFYAWYFREHDISAQVYAVDDRVELSSELVHAIGEDVNARGRAIALAIACERALGTDQRGVTVVIDADLLHIVGPVPLESSCLLWTDDAALENYALRPRPMGKFLKVCLHSSVKAASVLAAVRPALEEILAVRVVFKSLDLGMIEDIASVCDLSEDHSSVDTHQLILRSLTRFPKAEWPATPAEIEEMTTDYRSMVKEARQSGRGHDIAPLVCRFLQTQGDFARRDTIEAAMLGCIELVDLDDQPLFVALRSRLGAA